jgi:hypothetical protein
MGLLRFAKSVGTKIFGATETAACPTKVGEPTALRGPSGHDRDSLMGYVRRAPPQPGINTKHDN